MPINELNLSVLQERINNIRTETLESAEFCMTFIECLMKRHHLQECIMDNFSMEDVPVEIINSIKSGKIPTKDEMMSLSLEIQNSLCFELLWICGMGALIELGAHTDSNENDLSTLEIVVNMRSEGESFFIGSYIIAALTLLMGRIPSQNLILTLTNNFDSSSEQIQKNMEIFVEFASSILSKYHDELEC